MLVATLVVLATLPAPVRGQDTAQTDTARTDTAQTDTASGPTLTLDEAIGLARQSNPSFLQTKNDEAAAEWRVRSAYAQLLPGASVGADAQYQAPGQARYGLLTAADVGLGTTPAYYFSDYSFGLNYTLNGAALLRPSQERAALRATRATIDAASFDVASQVTTQYLNALRAQDALELADRQLESARLNAKLATVRARLGAASPIDSLQARVQEGRAEIADVQARAALHTERLRLGERIGVKLPPDTRLVTEFQVFDEDVSTDSLVALALRQSPNLLALRAQTSANEAALRSQWTRYLPTVSLQAGWSGYTRRAGDVGSLIADAQRSAESSIQSCQLFNNISAGLSTPLPDRPADCSKYALTDAQRNAVVRQNDAFPFSFTPQPMVMSLSVSLPLFQGFTRQRDLELARGQADDAKQAARAEELRLSTEISAAVEALDAARRSVAIENRDRGLAEAQLRLARERYRLGAGTFLELQDAEARSAQAQQSRLDALYTFHQSVVDLEALIGGRLRPDG